MHNIYYKEGYKYQLDKDYSVFVGFGLVGGGNDFVWLTPTGWLVCKRGYAWDGPSGPAIDTKNFMRASLVHDALYQLINLGVLGDTDKPLADDLMQEICLEDGMNPLRAWWVHKAVTKFGTSYLHTDNPVRKAP